MKPLKRQKVVVGRRRRTSVGPRMSFFARAPRARVFFVAPSPPPILWVLRLRPVKLSAAASRTRTPTISSRFLLVSYALGHAGSVHSLEEPKEYQNLLTPVAANRTSGSPAPACRPRCPGASSRRGRGPRRKKNPSTSKRSASARTSAPGSRNSAGTGAS